MAVLQQVCSNFTCNIPRRGIPSIQDQVVRLQQALCCLGGKGSALATKLKLGMAECCDINEFELHVAYLDILRCYDPTVTGNCLTQQEVDAIWDSISCYCGLCFTPYGTVYSLSAFSGPFVPSYMLTQDNFLFITEEGFQVTTE